MCATSTSRWNGVCTWYEMSGTLCFFILLIEIQDLWPQKYNRHTVQLPIARASSLGQVNDNLKELHDLLLIVHVFRTWVTLSSSYTHICRGWHMDYSFCAYVYMHDMYCSVRATWAATCLSGVSYVWWLFRTQFRTWWAKRSTWGCPCSSHERISSHALRNSGLILCVVCSNIVLIWHWLGARV